ncbi:MAG: TIGR01459 family HAD-type hydrolase [Pseudomonadota bacterium]
MTDFNFIDGLSQIADQYDALACDAWGVIHNGKNLLPGAADALVQFRQECGPVVIITNAPKPSSTIPVQLDRLGLPREAWNAIVTSGDATRAEIEKRLPAPAYRIGPAFDDPLFEGMNIDWAPLEGAAFMVCTGLNDGFKEEPEQYRAMLRDAAARKLPMVCANPDIQVNWGGRLMWCAGALAEIFESIGGQVVYGGKPYPPIYRLVSEKIAEAGGGDRTLAIGDGLKTDILGANNAGIDAVLIAGRGGLLEGDADRDAVAEKLRASRLKAKAVMDGLRW